MSQIIPAKATAIACEGRRGVRKVGRGVHTAPRVSARPWRRREDTPALPIWAILFLCLALQVTAAAPLPFTGVNLAGGEFWMPGKPKPGVRPQYGINYAYPTAAEIEYFSGKGMNIFRYQFLWETLQPVVRTPLDKADLERLKMSVLVPFKNIKVEAVYGKP